jgi:serine/threonine protein kinase
MRACPDDNTLTELANGFLEPARRLEAEAHMDACAACRRVVAAVVAQKSAPTVVRDGSDRRADGSGESPVVTLRSGRRIGNRYELERCVGQGGMGAVWSARDRRLERSVAIKCLLGSVMTEMALERFRREAMAIAKLRSSHIVEIYDYGAEGGSPYIVMELLEGEDLRSHLARRGPMPLGEVAAIVVQIARALAVAHAAGIIHRDLKPANVFLCARYGETLVKVFDFGLAKALGADRADSQSTGEDAVLGTPRFMSPEQFERSGAVDHRTDLWSLGVVAYIALTGRDPFTGSALGEVIHAILRHPAPPPSRFVTDLSPEIDAFFQRALAKNPAERFGSADEQATAFARLAAVSPDPSGDHVANATSNADARRVASPSRSSPRRLAAIGAAGAAIFALTVWSAAARLGASNTAVEQSPLGSGAAAPLDPAVSSTGPATSASSQSEPSAADSGAPAETAPADAHSATRPRAVRKPPPAAAAAPTPPKSRDSDDLFRSPW